MKSILSLFLTLLIGVSPMTACAKNNNPILEMTVADATGVILGTMELELYPEKAPKHVERILTLVTEGFYTGLKFHRVLDGFMVQTGCPYGTGVGGSKYPDLTAEFNEIKHERGVLSMARAASPNSANSQFFIMLGDAPYLDGQYTVFGRVIKNVDVIDLIKKGNQFQNGTVSNPSVIKEIKIK